MAHPGASFVRKTGQAMYLKNFLAQTEELKKTPSMRSWVSIFELTFAYLKEEVDTALFQEALRTALNACEADQRAYGILDNWLTGLFYFQESSLRWSKRKRMHRLVYLCWTECVTQMSTLTGSTDKQPCASMETLFDELALMGCNREMVAGKVANQTIALVMEFPQLSRLRIAVRQEGRALFRQRYYPIGWIRRVAMGCCGILTAALISACSILLYKVLVLFPLLRLTADAKSLKKSQALIEIAYQGVAFFQDGIQVFRSRLLIWCSLILILLAIDLLARWVSRRWVR